MPRFVILTHDHPFPHWDFLLEEATAARTWRLLEEPTADRTIAAEAIPDHRLFYLDYEGPVSGGRGEVRRWDAGEYDALEMRPERVRIVLHGERLRGVAVLARQPSGGWTFAVENLP